MSRQVQEKLLAIVLPDLGPVIRDLRASNATSESTIAKVDPRHDKIDAKHGQTRRSIGPIDVTTVDRMYGSQRVALIAVPTSEMIIDVRRVGE